jgi:hypothetical protein
MKYITFRSMNPIYGRERENYPDQPCTTMQNFLENVNETNHASKNNTLLLLFQHFNNFDFQCFQRQK